MKKLATFSLLLLLAIPPLSLAQEESESEDSSYWEQIVALYESAKETGEQVPKDIYDWTLEDLSNIGDWEYKVLEISMVDSTALEEQLNELGADRWDCIWIQTKGTKTTFIFKRPSRSYLRNIPLGELLKLVPTGSLGGGE